MFLLIRIVNRIDEAFDEQFDDKDIPEQQQKKKCPYCRTVIPYLAVRCPYCTSELGEKPAN